MSPASESSAAPDPADRTASTEAPRRVVGPIVQFMLLMVPIVINSFYFLYAFMGLILEGRDRLNWAIDAQGTWRVGITVIGFGVLTCAFVGLRGGSPRHPLVVSGIGHGVLALLLMALVFVTTRG